MKPENLVVVTAIPDHDESKLTDLLEIFEETRGFVLKVMPSDGGSILVFVRHRNGKFTPWGLPRKPIRCRTRGFFLALGGTWRLRQGRCRPLRKKGDKALQIYALSLPEFVRRILAILSTLPRPRWTVATTALKKLERKRKRLLKLIDGSRRQLAS
jgi:hypothetical protein